MLRSPIGGKEQRNLLFRFVADAVEAGSQDVRAEVGLVGDQLHVLRPEMPVQQGEEIGAGQLAEVVIVVGALAGRARGVFR